MKLLKKMSTIIAILFISTQFIACDSSPEDLSESDGDEISQEEIEAAAEEEYEDISPKEVTAVEKDNEDDKYEKKKNAKEEDPVEDDETYEEGSDTAH